MARVIPAAGAFVEQASSTAPPAGTACASTTTAPARAKAGASRPATRAMTAAQSAGGGVSRSRSGTDGKLPLQRRLFSEDQGQEDLRPKQASRAAATVPSARSTTTLTRATMEGKAAEASWTPIEAAEAGWPHNSTAACAASLERTPTQQIQAVEEVAAARVTAADAAERSPAAPQPIQPLRSALRRTAGLPIRETNAAPKSISFTGQNVTQTIENFAQMGDSLWYPNFAVDCDRCDASVRWGAEGSFVSTPGQSRFSQWQVLCSNCLADRFYSEMGVWLIIGLAASCNSDQEGTCSVAHDPIVSALDSLLRINPSAGSDQLTALLGKEAETPEVRAVVLQKARSQVAAVLGHAGDASVGTPQPAAVKREGGRKRVKVEEDKDLEGCASKQRRSGKCPRVAPVVPPPLA